MNRQHLQQLSAERIEDAKSLLAASRWSGAYYLSGYAVECALKSCILHRIENTGIIFELKKFAEECWTHDIEALTKKADLDNSRGLASPHIHDTNIGEAYGELLRIMQAPRFGSLNPFQVKLLNAADPLPIAAATVQSRYQIPQPIPFHGSSLAETAINGAYIYPATTLAGSTP